MPIEQPLTVPLLTPVPGTDNQFVWVGVAPSVAACWQVVFRDCSR